MGLKGNSISGAIENHVSELWMHKFFQAELYGVCGEAGSHVVRFSRSPYQVACLVNFIVITTVGAFNCDARSSSLVRVLSLQTDDE